MFAAFVIFTAVQYMLCERRMRKARNVGPYAPQDRDKSHRYSAGIGELGFVAFPNAAAAQGFVIVDNAKLSR
jgi:hypothetical protein